MKLRNGKTINECIIGYKLCRDNHLVILEIPPTAKHNMDRSSIVNKQFAKHRCSEALVKEIINLINNQSVSEAFSMNALNFKYTVGQKILPDGFDPNVELVCSSGIHYFLDRKRAEMYTNFPGNFPKDGEFAQWKDNGTLIAQLMFKNGRKHGECKWYYENGQLEKYRIYVNGKEEGEAIEWYKNGQMREKCLFVDGKMHGELITWYENGQKQTHVLYNNGELEGKYEIWYDSGQMSSRAYYKQFNLEGEYITWYINGQMREKYLFVDGKMHGEYMVWHIDGRLIQKLNYELGVPQNY